MSESTKRFGVGLLDAKRKQISRPGEACSNREIGLFGTISEQKGGDGDRRFISYDYMTRFKSSLENFKTKLLTAGHLGKVVKIDVSEEPATVLENGKPLATPELLVTASTKMIKSIRVFADVDIIDTRSGVPIKQEATVTVQYTLAHDADRATALTYRQTEALSVINDTTFTPDYTGYETLSDSVDHKFTFDAITVTIPPEVDAKDMTIVLNNLMMCYIEAEDAPAPAPEPTPTPSDEPKKEEPKQDVPAEQPKQEEPKQEDKPAEEQPKADEPKQEEPKQEDKPADQPTTGEGGNA